MSGFGLHTRQRLTRLVVLVVALLHLGVAIAPHVASASDASPGRPHLHAVGDQLEAVHNEAACPACNGMHLGPRPTVAVRLSLAPPTSFRAPDTRQHPLQSATQYHTVLSRAPPAAA